MALYTEFSDMKFFFISILSVSSAISFNNFGNTVHLRFNGLTGVNSLCSIYLTEDAKKVPPSLSANFFEDFH